MRNEAAVLTNEMAVIDYRVGVKKENQSDDFILKKLVFLCFFQHITDVTIF